MKKYSKSFKKAVKFGVSFLSSPKAIGMLKLAAAVLAVIHAADELGELATQKRKVGFAPSDDE